MGALVNISDLSDRVCGFPLVLATPSRLSATPSARWAALPLFPTGAGGRPVPARPLRFSMQRLSVRFCGAEG